MNLATLGEDNVLVFGEYVALAFEGREITNVDQVRFVDALPKSPIGKILRKELRALAG